MNTNKIVVRVNEDCSIKLNLNKNGRSLDVPYLADYSLEFPADCVTVETPKPEPANEHWMCPTRGICECEGIKICHNCKTPKPEPAESAASKLITQIEDAQAATANSKMRFGPEECTAPPFDKCLNCDDRKTCARYKNHLKAELPDHSCDPCNEREHIMQIGTEYLNNRIISQDARIAALEAKEAKLVLVYPMPFRRGTYNGKQNNQAISRKI